jgi:hypothetical protein
MGAVVSMHRPPLQASAIVGLARGLAHLHPSLRDELVNMALNLRTNNVKHVAIGGLGAALEQLNQAQREALVTAATDIDSSRRHGAIAGLGQESHHLTLSQREALVTAAMQIDDVGHRAEALAGLAKGAAKRLLLPGPALAS